MGKIVCHHLLINSAEVFQNVLHTAFLQQLTGMGFGKAVNSNTVCLVHLTLHEVRASLSNSHHVQ